MYSLFFIHANVSLLSQFELSFVQTPKVHALCGVFLKLFNTLAWHVLSGLKSKGDAAL